MEKYLYPITMLDIKDDFEVLFNSSLNESNNDRVNNLFKKAKLYTARVFKNHILPNLRSWLGPLGGGHSFNELLPEAKEMSPFNFTVEIEFKYHENGNHVRQCRIKDNINKLYIEVDFCNFDLTIKLFDSEEFYFFEEYIKYDFLNSFSPFIKIFPDLQYSIPSAKSILNNDFEQIFDDPNFVINPSSNNYNNKIKSSFRLWESKTLKTKKNIFYLVVKFLYLTTFHIPDLITKFLKYTYLPTTRELPKSRYNLTDSRFEIGEYYGILNNIYNDQERKIKNSKMSLSYVEIFNLLSSPKANNKLYVNLNKLGIYKVFFIEKKHGNGTINLIDATGKISNIANESSGLQQILPILLFLNDLEISQKINKDTVAIKRVINDKNIFIEQPELHLHPKLQCGFAEVLANYFNFGDKFNISDSIFEKSMILETHSEHLIRKIQVQIAKGELEKENIGVWYFDNSEGTTKIKEMEIEPNGFFKEPWPNGFFDESYNLSKELLFPNKN